MPGILLQLFSQPPGGILHGVCPVQIFPVPSGLIELRFGEYLPRSVGHAVKNHGEYAMLYCMASSPGQVFSKAQLYEAAWGEAYLHGTNSVENIIWRLRRKLEEDPKHPGYIKTVVGAGYKIDIHNRQSGMED